MSEIISPLDEIIEVVENIQQSSHTERRASLNDNILSIITKKVNEAKNAIIMHLLNKQQYVTDECINVLPNAIKTLPSDTPKVDKSCHKLIIPTDSHVTPSKEISLDIEKNVKNILKNTKTYATIAKINPTSRGNVVVHFDKNDNISNITQKLKDKFGTKVKVIEPILPKIIVHNLPNTMDCSDKTSIVQNILESNAFIKESVGDCPSKFELLFTYDTNGSTNAVIKCCPEIRKLIINNSRRIRVDMSLCRTSDRVYVPHCTKCQQRNHTLKSCQKSSFTCAFCGQNHSTIDCQLKDNPDKHSCSNCTNSDVAAIKSQANTHNTFSKLCPVYRGLQIKQINKTNWAGSPPTFT